MPQRRVLLSAALVVAPLVLGACPPSSSDANAPAAQLAALYVTLDTLGDGGAADTLLACAESRVDSQIAPTTYVSVGAPVRDSRSDTVSVLVVYEVLGLAHQEDATTAGPLYWRFTSQPRNDTVQLRVAPDSAGRMWIACGEFSPNHPMIGELTQAVKLMDSVSAHELELAKSGKPSARQASQ